MPNSDDEDNTRVIPLQGKDAQKQSLVKKGGRVTAILAFLAVVVKTLAPAAVDFAYDGHEALAVACLLIIVATTVAALVLLFPPRRRDGYHGSGSPGGPQRPAQARLQPPRPQLPRAPQPERNRRRDDVRRAA